MSDEQWRPIPDFPGYEASDLGNVRSVRGAEARVLRTYAMPKRGGYLQVRLKVSGRTHYLAVHRLVTEAFIGPRPAAAVTRHLNGDPQDNRLENLCYGTQSENMWDAVRHGTHSQAKKTSCINGHLLSPDNTYVRKGGGRDCVTCAKARTAASKARRRAAA